MTRLACSSTSFAAAIDAGRMTQLEWLDRCSATLDVDGVVFAAAHFARTDGEYVAQLKKMSADLRLTVAAVACDAVLAEGDGAAQWFDVASGLGAPLLIARCPPTAGSVGWNDIVAACKRTSAHAKGRNVTLAIRNDRTTPCASVADLARLAKDVDSSWLRFALDAAEFDPPEPLDPLLRKTVITAHTVHEEPDGGELARHVLPAVARLGGFLVLDAIGPSAPARLGEALARAREVLAHHVLGAGGGEPEGVLPAR